MAFSRAKLKRWLPKRPRDAHKGDFGHVLVVAGSRGMTGAAVLVAKGALRSGCGLVTVALPQSQQPIVAAHLAEAMTLPLPETSSGAVRSDAVGRLQASHQTRRFTLLALGPGLSQHADTAKAVVGLLDRIRVPAVLDADALNLLASESSGEVRRLLEGRGAPTVMTPHPGEASRLLKTDVEQVQRDRNSAARLLVGRFGGVCLLKGAKTVICDSTNSWLNPTGNPGLAKGGSGDALTGILAGLWAQRLRNDELDNGFEAAALAAYLHGSAADIAAKALTERCLLASDVIAALPQAFRKLGG
jgi:hydroxyethylthiazole kinase-like uncharacterized protein yjeF